jgi:hypothetical protein
MGYTCPEAFQDLYHAMIRLHSLVERNLTKFDLQFLDLFLIIYIYIL